VEQLVGSQTFFGTFTTQFFLRSFNLLGLGLLLFWSLSPLGGQSSLHIIDTVYQPIASNDSLLYFNTRATSAFESGGDFRGVLPPLNALYFSSLMAPEAVKSSSMDLWGNVKIPRLANLESPNDAGWYDVPRSNTSYTSLMGVPIAGLRTGKNTTFNLESSYLDLNCINATLGDQINITTTPVESGKMPNTTYYGGNGSGMCKTIDCLVSFSLGMDHFASINWTFGYPEAVVNNSILINGSQPSLDPLKTFVDVRTPTVLFQSRFWGQSRFNYASSRVFCHLEEIYVESAIRCDVTHSQPNCSVISIRESKKDHPPSTVTSLSFSSVFWNFADSLGASSGGGHPATSSPTEMYLVNPASPLMTQSDSGLKIYGLPLPTLSLRLTQIFNSYWQGSINPESMVGDFAEAPFQTYSGPPSNLTASGSSTSLKLTYVVDWGWLSLFVLATSALFIAAIAGVVLDHLSIGPDILCFASSLTRDTPYVRLPRGGSTLDGHERARLLKDLRVRVGDVKSGNQEAGFIAFGSDGVAGRMGKGRYYD
jgi:hypothetical protein